MRCPAPIPAAASAFALTLALAAAPPARAAEVDWGHRVVAAHDPDGRWAKARYLRLTLTAVQRDGRRLVFGHTLWDKRTGAVRFEADATIFSHLKFYDERGVWRPHDLGLPPGRLVGLIDRATARGRVYLDGRPLDDPSLPRRVAQRVDVDTFRPLLPLLVGPPARLVEAPDAPSGPTALLALSFPTGSGSGAGDVWRLEVDRATSLVVRASVWPQNQALPAPLVVTWTKTEKIGGILFGTRFDNTDGIGFEYALELPAEVPEGAFTDPGPRAPK